MLVLKWKTALAIQSCPTLWDTMGCSPLGSSDHRILQARILEWIAIPFSRGSSWPPPVNSGVVRDEGSIPWVRKIPWSRKWQPGPVLSPGKFHGQRSLVDYSPWSCKESVTIDRLSALEESGGRLVLVKFSGTKLLIIHCFSNTLLQNRHAISYSFQIWHAVLYQRKEVYLSHKYR